MALLCKNDLHLEASYETPPPCIKRWNIQLLYNSCRNVTANITTHTHTNKHTPTYTCGTCTPDHPHSGGGSAHSGAVIARFLTYTALLQFVSKHNPYYYYTHAHKKTYTHIHVHTGAINIEKAAARTVARSLLMRGGGLGSRPKKMYGERLGDGVEYHLKSPTPRR